LPSVARGWTAETADDNGTLGPVDQYYVAEDIQSEFAAIKDTLTKVKLPANLRLCESRQGIQRSDQTAFNILSRFGRYAETTIKLLSTIDEEKIDEQSLQKLFSVQLAQIRYLQEEYSALVVQSQFYNSTARIFRSLQENTSGLGCGQNLGTGPWASPWVTLWATLWATLLATLWATPKIITFFFLLKKK